MGGLGSCESPVTILKYQDCIILYNVLHESKAIWIKDSEPELMRQGNKITQLLTDK